MSSGSARSATKRLLRELNVWEKEAPAETGIERLGPVNEDELLRWEAVINGRGVGGGYDGSLITFSFSLRLHSYLLGKT
jgi:peroxin-4